MAYDAFDQTKPVISDTRANVVAETNQNIKALRDMIVNGGDGSLAWAWAITAGTNDQPTTIVLSNGTQRQRWVLTWSGNDITAITASYSSNSGTLYDTIGTFTFGFSGDDVVSGNVGSFVLAMLVKCISEARDAYGNLSSHSALTGTAVHGLGTMSTQTASAVAITGGTINNATIGATTPALATFRGVREVHTGVAFGGATTNLDLSGSASFAITATGTGAAALTVTNPPPTSFLYTFALILTNGGLRTWTWPTGTKWAGGAAPTLTAAGLDILTFTTYDGGTSWIGSLYGKAFA